jgi:hypothetical protein
MVSAPFFLQLMLCLEPIIEIMSVNASTFEKDLVRSASNFSARKRRLIILRSSNLAAFWCLVVARRFQWTLSLKKISP